MLSHAPLLAAAQAVIRARVENVVSAHLAQEVAHDTQARVDIWKQKANAAQTGHGSLIYSRPKEDHDRPLLRSPQRGRWQLFTCPESMREVEGMSNLVLIEEETEGADAREDETVTESGGDS